MTDEPKPIADILDRSSPAPAPDPSPKSETPAPEPKVDATGRLHGEGGKFAPKTKAETPSVDHKPTIETGVKPSEPLAPPANVKSAAPEGYVPIAALVDTRLEAREAKRRADDLQRQLADLQKPKAEPVDWFADPEAAGRQLLSPVEDRQRTFEQKLILRASRAEAVLDHGKEAVAEMENAIQEALDKQDPEVMQLGAQMHQSEHPAGLAMQWFQRRRVHQEVGDDPVAYREKLRAEIVAELQANGGQQPPADPQRPAAPAPVMPSNLANARNVGQRSGPAWSGPAAIGDIFSRKRQPG